MTRKEILDAALKCVNGERDQIYGRPENNFDLIARLWADYLGSTPNNREDRYDVYIGSEDVAAMLALLKIARIASGNYKDDNWIDLAGYAACGGEVQSNRNDEDKYTITESGEKVIKSAVRFDDVDKYVKDYNLKKYKEENDRLREDLAIAKKQLKVKELQEQLCGINLEGLSHKIYHDEIAPYIKPPEPVYCCTNNYAETIKKLEEQLKDANEKIGDLLNLQFNSGIHTNPEESDR